MPRILSRDVSRRLGIATVTLLGFLEGVKIQPLDAAGTEPADEIVHGLDLHADLGSEVHGGGQCIGLKLRASRLRVLHVIPPDAGCCTALAMASAALLIGQKRGAEVSFGWCRRPRRRDAASIGGRGNGSGGARAWCRDSTGAVFRCRRPITAGAADEQTHIQAAATVRDARLAALEAVDKRRCYRLG